MTMEKVNQATSFYSSQITGNVEDVVDSFSPSPLVHFKKKNGKLDIDALWDAYMKTQPDNDPDATIATMSATFRLAKEEVNQSGTRAYALYQEARDHLGSHCKPPIPTTYRRPGVRQFGAMPMEIQDLLTIAKHKYQPDGEENEELRQRWIHWLEGKSRGTWRRRNKSSRRPEAKLTPRGPPRKRSLDVEEEEEESEEDEQDEQAAEEEGKEEDEEEEQGAEEEGEEEEEEEEEEGEEDEQDEQAAEEEGEEEEEEYDGDEGDEASEDGEP
jgi:hypothetical protein